MKHRDVDTLLKWGVINPQEHAELVREAFVGLDLAAGDDRAEFFVVERGLDGTLRYEPLPQPTGHITVDGEPMAYWLPDGVTAESLGITTTD